jgi:NAD(P)-dependent dehydrogenase (short-subunit alcohol dehydrogenase family)
MRIEGNVIVIAGGARGLGAYTAEYFHEHGGKIVILDVLNEYGELLAARL